MAGVEGGFFNCVDFREILQNSSSLKPLVRLGLFALYGHEEILKKSFSLKPLVRYFEIISQECFLGDPFQKLFTKF